MYGFKAAQQRLADGGLVGVIKSKFFGPEETVSQKFARQDAERAAKAAAKAGAAPAPAPAPTPAGQGISGYAGMSAMQRREKEAGLKDGGIIRGPGTGTSDSIEAEMDEGTYIMPADSTQALGFNPIARLAGQKQKVRVSNGETEITPEQVQEIGAAVLDVVKALTHVPTPEQEPPGAYAEGGLVEDTIERGRRAAPYVNHRPYTPPPASALATVPPPAYQPNFTMGAAATGAPDPVSDVRPKFNPANATPEAKAWMAERAAQQAGAAPAAPAAPTAAPAAAPAARTPGPVARAAQRVGGAAATLARGATPLLLGGAAASTASTPTEDYDQRFGFEPSTSDSPAARLVRDVGVRALGAASDVGNALGFGLPSMMYRDRQAQAGAAPAAPAAPATPAARLVQTDVQRGGGAVPAVEEVAMSAPSVAPAQGPVARLAAGGDARYGFSNFNQAAQAEQALASQNPAAMNFGAYVPGQGLDAWQARQDRKNAETAASSIVNSGTRDAARRTLARMDAQDIQRTRDAGALAQEQVRADTARAAQAVTQQNNIAGQAAEQQRLGFEARRTAADEALKGTQNASAAQILAAQRRLAAATTPEAKAAAESEILALQGRRDNPQRFTVVPGGQEIDQATGLPVKRPDRVLNNQTGQFVDLPAAAPKLPPGMTRQVGTSGGKPVYEDANGKRFIGG